MSGYLQGEALLDACRAGLGKIVIVEGEPLAEVALCTADVTCDEDPAPLLACAQPFYEKAADCPRLPREAIAAAEIQCKSIPPYGCSSGLQIPETWVCDYFADCPDEADEADEAGCPNSFECADGSMYFPLDYKCDGIADCPDDSDEADCP